MGNYVLQFGCHYYNLVISDDLKTVNFASCIHNWFYSIQVHKICVHTHIKVMQQGKSNFRP